jgi:Flp pilus assembly protein TadG
MRRLRSILALGRDTRGTMAVETAIVVPVLALMSLGSFEVSGMVARQTELQTAASEAAQLVLASAPTTAEQRSTVKQIIRASTGLSASQVTLTQKYRCGATASLQTTVTCANATDKLSTYLEIYMTQTYTPTWTEFGVGHPMTYRVTRRVMIS